MPVQCEHEGCTADAVFLTTILPATPGSITLSKRCEVHKYTRPEGTVAQALPLPPEQPEDP